MINKFLLLIFREWKLMLIKTPQTLVLFFFIIISVAIFAISLRYLSIDKETMIAFLWILLFLVTMIKVEKVYTEDFSEAKLQQYIVSRFAMETIVLIKNFLIYLNLMFFFFIFSPIIFLLLSLDFSIFWHINLLVSLSLLSMVFISSITSSITISSSNRLAITSIMTLPLFIPIIIFSISSSQLNENNDFYLFFIAYFLLNLAFSPLLTSFALKKLQI